MFFEYGEAEINYLQKKDSRLAEVIDKVGHIEREVDADIFSAIIHHIVAQQISAKALATVWKKFFDKFAEISAGKISAEKISAAEVETLQSCGMSLRKAGYIKNFAEKVQRGEFDLNALEKLSDADAVKKLTELKGVGTWTAEMILLFCLQRKNIFSFNDLAIQRGLQFLYHHKKITPQLFEKYRRRFSPYCSVASLYLWEVAGGKVPGLQ